MSVNVLWMNVWLHVAGGGRERGRLTSRSTKQASEPLVTTQSGHAPLPPLSCVYNGTGPTAHWPLSCTVAREGGKDRQIKREGRKDMYWDTIIKPGDRTTDTKDSKIKVSFNLNFSFSYFKKKKTLKEIMSFIHNILHGLYWCCNVSESTYWVN